MTAGRLDLAALLLVAAGAAIAGYLTWTYAAGVAPVCATGGCAEVQSSDYATLAAIPVALLGLVHYVLVGALVLLRQHAAAAALAVAGVLFAAYLLVVQVWVIEALCSWCLANDAVAALLAAVLVLRVSGRGPARAA